MSPARASHTIVNRVYALSTVVCGFIAAAFRANGEKLRLASMPSPKLTIFPIFSLYRSVAMNCAKTAVGPEVGTVVKVTAAQNSIISA
jgi:hypothetical protein